MQRVQREGAPALCVASFAVDGDESNPYAVYELVFTTHYGGEIVAWRRWSQCAAFSKLLQRDGHEVPRFPSAPTDFLVGLMGNARFEEGFLESRRILLEAHFRQLLARAEDEVVNFLRDEPGSGSVTPRRSGSFAGSFADLNPARWSEPSSSLADLTPLRSEEAMAAAAKAKAAALKAPSKSRRSLDFSRLPEARRSLDFSRLPEPRMLAPKAGLSQGVVAPVARVEQRPSVWALPSSVLNARTACASMAVMAAAVVAATT